MRHVYAGALGLALGLGTAARADEFAWRPAARRPEASLTSSVSLGVPRPAVSLGRPEAVGTSDPSSDARTDAALLRVSFRVGDPLPAPATVRGQIPDPGPTLTPPPGAPAAPLPPPNPAEPYNCGVVNEPPPPAGTGFWGKCKNIFAPCGQPSGNRAAFQSDHGFDDFISPVSNPFLFEDPRSLTELRPIFIYQEAPIKNSIYRGGDIEYLALQGRLALTERLDVVLSKAALVWIEPHADTDGFENHFGLAEIWLGPKYTLYRCENTGTVAALGLNFQIPGGSSGVQQNTGSLSLEPYISVGQKLGFSSFGSFHVMDTLGYSVAVDSERTDYVFNSLHLDYDVANLHKIYPLIELNYFHYTSNGKVRPLDFEGQDLFNLGSTAVSGHDILNLAVGARYKFSECVQAGLAAEFPVTGRHDLLQYRITADLIFRY